MKKGKLFLIPSGLGTEIPGEIIPPANMLIINKLKVFIVENLKTTRRFLRKINPDFDIDNTLFLELNKHTREEDYYQFLKFINKGEDAALLSEAGLPCVADPGAEIVEIAHQQNIIVKPLSGPSSIMMALMASGFNGQNFTFHGYLPVKKPERESMLKQLEKDVFEKKQTQIFIETPYRNMQMVDSIIRICKGKTRLCIAGNLTTNDEFIKTMNIQKWQKQRPMLHKIPAVFLLYK